MQGMHRHERAVFAVRLEAERVDAHYLVTRACAQVGRAVSARLGGEFEDARWWLERAYRTLAEYDMRKAGVRS